MIQSQDREMLGTMLGVDEQSLPERVEHECAIRTKMYHSAGSSGPLGALALIAMLRALDLGPKPDPDQPARIDWRQYPDDGTVRVEARYFGGWQPGVFLGFIANGTLAIRLDNQEGIAECRYDIVRLAPVDMHQDQSGTWRDPMVEFVVPPELRAEAKRMVDAVCAEMDLPEGLATFTVPTIASGTADPVSPVPVKEPTHQPPTATVEPAGGIVSVQGQAEEDDEPDWKTVAIKSKVFVQHDGDYVRGLFLGLGATADELRVGLVGVPDELTVTRDLVRYTGPPVA
jgi:hypothetical protein